MFLVGGKTLEVQEQEVELDGVHKVTGLVSMQETLVLRARVFAMLELVPFNLMVKLNDRYTGLVRRTVPEKMRPPTLNEIRRFDRELMKQALRWKSEGQGELGDCLEYYLDTPNASLWRLLEPVPEAVPDQGIERTHEGGGTTSTDGRMTKARSVVPMVLRRKSRVPESKPVWFVGRNTSHSVPFLRIFGRTNEKPRRQQRRRSARTWAKSPRNRDSSVTGFFLRPATG